MVNLNNISHEIPYKIFKKKYNEALSLEQEQIEAISISSYSDELKEVNARYVNLKFVKDKEFIFFSNYNSPKSKEFKNHNQITALIFWSSINLQIRMKAYINKTPKEFNQSYFRNRDKSKNALAISSEQSAIISSYKNIEDNFKKTLENHNLEECPEYWGGFSFIPYYFEFWEGHKYRLNNRKLYEIKDGKWHKSTLQP